MVAIWLEKEKVHTPTGDFDAAKASRSLSNGLGQIARP